MPTVTSADGTTIAYDRSGEGPPVIGLHGTGVRRSIWSLLAGQFDDGTLLAPDRRGRGDSGDTSPYDFEREVEDVQALVRTCDSAPVLFGSSFGGLLAMKAAQSVDIAGLVLYEPPLPQATLDERDTPERSLADQTAEHIDAGEPEAAAKTFFTQATGAESVEHWPIWPACVEFAQTIPRECRTVERFDLSTAPTQYPTLCFTGTESPDYLQAGIDKLAETVPDHTVVTLDGIGHAGVATAPGEIAAHLGSFVR